MLLNALVIIVLATKQRPRTPDTIHRASLAATGFLVGAIVHPLFMAAEINPILGLGLFCMFDTVLEIAGIGVCLASVGHLVLISVER